MSESHDSGRGGRPPATAPREPVFNLPPVVLLLIGVCVLVYVIQDYVLTPSQYLSLLVEAAFIPIRYSGQFALDLAAFTSPFTYAFLHGSVAHLAVNMIWLAAFGSPLANRLGALRFLVFWAAASLSAVALHYVLHRLDQSPLVGASGAISGMMGAAARFGFRIDRGQGRAAFSGAPLPVSVCLRSRAVGTFQAIRMAINLLTGLVSFAPGIDDRIAWEAHIGGCLVGFFAIGAFEKLPGKEPPPLDPPDEPEGPRAPN